MWGGTDVKIPTGIRFMAAKGAHALLPSCPFCGPAKAHPNSELLQDRIRALRASQTIISAAMDIYTFRYFD